MSVPEAVSRVGEGQRSAPLLLSIDTATPRGIVTISRAEALIASSVYVAGSDHAEKLLDHVRAVLEGAAARLEDIEAYGLGVGPGSFTGVRVGVTTVKGLSLRFPRPIIPVPTLLSLAVASGAAGGKAESSAPGDRVGVLLSAGREDCFAQVFSPSGGLGAVEVVAHSALRAWFEERGVRAAIGQDVPAWLGEAFTDLTRDGGLPTAESLAGCAARAFAAGAIVEGEAALSLEPLYARPPQITTARPRPPTP